MEYVYSINKEGKRLSEYLAWRSMRFRCLNKKCHAFADYGGRGIKICKRWDDFQNFIKDMGFKPSPKHTLDRIDNDKNYTPKNCRWATMKEQCNNRRNNVWIDYKGKKRTLQGWADYLGVNSSNLGHLLKKNPISDVIKYYKNGGRGVNITYNGDTKKISEWAKDLRITNRHFRDMLKRESFELVYVKYLK
jgi:hypothetical protein